MAENQCFGRLVDDTKTGRFADGHKFHLELRCARKTIPGTKLCGMCHEKTRDFDTRTSSGKKIGHPQVLHGLIDEPIPFESHIFEGPWYQKRLKDWGEPCPEEMAKGKKAQLEAAGEIHEAPVPPPPTTPVEVSAPATKKRAPKKAVEEQPTMSVAVPKKKREPKAAIQTPGPKLVEAPIPVTKVEVVAKEAIEYSTIDKPVFFIKVRRFNHNGRKYFLDSKKNKLYAVGTDNQPGIYHGRWNPESETMDTSFPDSDAEVARPL